MRAFKIEESIANVAETKLKELYEFCKANNVPFVAGLCTRTTKNGDRAEGITVSREVTACYTGEGYEIAEFVAASKFLGDDWDTGEEFVHLHRNMLETFGALLTEDDSANACRAFLATGDLDEARRVGGSQR